ncbi:hypothetical protein J1N35_004662, partial [Gossypium stocksii]
LCIKLWESGDASWIVDQSKCEKGRKNLRHRDKTKANQVSAILKAQEGVARMGGGECYGPQFKARDHCTKCIPKRSLSKKLWSPPDFGFIKFNFDATFQSDSRNSTTTVLARYSKRKVVGAETYLFEDVVDAFVDEARACERALLFAFRMGFRCLLVEGDSLMVIKKLKAKGEDKSIIRSIIHHIRTLENCFEEVLYLFVSRLVNGASHTLAMEGKRRQSSGIWVDGVSVLVRTLVEKDRMVWAQRHQVSS